ncbi:F-box/LRR-repeat protein At3g48880-like [Lotus japonicus]|uniref:F-box/LRR-repeat protein At3g48880-like n=1 Tax=Lotus japonicus TaxID=34305 RepID=UPI00258E5514|nr:F-box/LRR-repeat protein At3g48880-like [Lotus japonicus]
MKKSKSASRYSNDHLPYDILVKIFMVLNVVDLGIVSLVCKSWKSASSDRALWHKVDLSRLSSRFFDIPSDIIFWTASDKRSTSTKMAQFLKHALSLSGENISCLIFNFYIPLTDIQLITAAQRTPNLKRLVLPYKGSLTKRAIHTAMASWRGLESMTITSMINCRYLFSAISKWCKNIVELKFTDDFNQNHADALIKYTPNLKVLSLRTTMVEKKALEDALDGLKHLKVANMCHASFT